MTEKLPTAVQDEAVQPTVKLGRPRKHPPGTKRIGPKARAKVKQLRAEADRITKGLPTPAAPAQPPPSEPPLTLVTLGPPPGDALGAQNWAHRATILTMHHTMNDSTISERERRKEIRTLATAAAKLMPTSRVWEAEQAIKKFQAEIDKKQSEKGEPEAVPMPPPRRSNAPRRT